MEIGINMVEMNINNLLTPEQATEQLISGWDSGTVKNSADVEELLKFGADINITDENGVTVLMKAAKTIDDKECLNLLLKSGLSVSTRDSRGRTALIAALASLIIAFTAIVLFLEYPVVAQSSTLSYFFPSTVTVA